MDCNLLTEKNQISDPEMAAHLLHYAATQKESDFEYAMIFEKFLCNIPISHSINRHIILPAKFKKHVDDMLASAIEYWQNMKGSSNELFRNEFLQRPGKIIFKNNNPKIIIEKKTQDILLEKIPWPISIIKLEWMQHHIFVDW